MYLNKKNHCTEWKTFRQLLVKQPRDTTASQLKELVSNDMLKAMFPNLHKIGSIGLTIPVSTASVERSFSQMKLIKTRLRNALSDCSLSHLVKIAIETPAILFLTVTLNVRENQVESQFNINLSFSLVKFF